MALAGCNTSSPRPSPESKSTPARPGATASSLPSTAWDSVPPSRVRSGGALRLAVPTFPANFNAYAGAENQAIQDVLAPTTGSAIRFNADGTWKVDPNYATSVRARRGAELVVDVVLNEDAVWSDGTPIVAADMVSWWRATSAADQKFNVPSSVGFDDIAGVRQGKNRFAYTVTFKRRITDWPLYVYPGLPASVTGSAAAFNTGLKNRAAPSNGPFVISRIDRAAGTITEVRNPRWWGAQPKLRTVTFTVIDPTLQARAFVAGRIDALDLGGDVPSYEVASRRPDARIERAAGLDWTQLTFNGTRGPLTDVRVRRAIAHAIDRKAISARVNAPLGAPAQTQDSMIYVRGQKGYRDAATAAVGFDPAEAAALLSAAGYARGADGRQRKDGKPLTLTITVPADTPASELRAQAIERDLGKVGITLTRKTVPADAFFDDYVVPLNFDLVTFSWRNAILPVTAAQPRFNPIDSGQNYTGITSPKLPRLWRQANAETNQDKRISLAHAIDRELFSYVPIVPIAPVPVVFAVADKLANYGAAQFEHPNFTRVGFTK